MRQIAIFLPSLSQNVREDLDNKGTGAREQVADWLAHSLTKDGYTVHVFTNQEDPVHEHDDVYRGEIHYINSEMAGAMLTNYEWDAVISFDYPSIMQLEEIRQTCNKVIVAQNYYEIPPEGQPTPEMLDLIDHFIYPSEYALKECSEANGVDPAKGIVIPYTYDERFFGSEPNKMNPEKGFKFIYANQAESGLAQLLREWPRILRNWPGSTLTVATAVEEFVERIQWSHSIQSELALDIRDMINQDGVRYIGRQGRPALAKEMAAADYLLFPAAPLMPSEIGSLPIMQAIASGCVPIFVDVDALVELYGKQGIVIPRLDLFANHTITVVEHGEKTYPIENTPEVVFQKWLDVIG